MQVFNLLATGMGGIDWAGLPLMVAYFGITDVEALIADLSTLLTHRPPKPDADGAEPADTLGLND